MLNRERLYSITGLTVNGGLDKLSDNQLNMYYKSMDSFIDRFPAQGERLQDSLDNEAPLTVISGIVSPIYDTLKRLHADSIVREYKPKFDKLLSAAQADYTALESLAENFIHAVSSLSIEVQMAAHAKGAPAAATRIMQTGAPAAAPPQPEHSRTAAGTKQIYSRNEKKILAVDNAVMYLNTLKKLLESYPYDLFCTTSCDEALKYVVSNRPDLILLDIEMPEMDGYELARRIKQGGCKAPIIFITANSAREYVDKAVEVGADGLLMKPLRSTQLISKISEFI